MVIRTKGTEFQEDRFHFGSQEKKNKKEKQHEKKENKVMNENKIGLKWWGMS